MSVERLTARLPGPRRAAFLPFGQPDIRDEDIAEVVDTLHSGWLGTGPKTKRFEAAFAEYVGAAHAVGLNSCTAALHLALLGLGVGPGDEVITSAMTFAATVNVILHVGAKPVIVDIDPLSQNVDPGVIERAIGPATRAILPVHMAGRPCDMVALARLAEDHDLFLIDDAAHAAEARWGEHRIGSIGRASAFSFYVTKNIVTGEGGMLTTSDDALADDARIRSLHGMSRDAWKRYSSAGFQPYDVVLPGWKYNMTDMQAALGLHQLARVESNLHRREEVWGRYDEAFVGHPLLSVPAPFEDGRHARHLYTLQLDIDRAPCDRDELVDRLRQLNIGSGVHFVGVQRHTYFREHLGLRPADYPNAERVSERTISLPLSSRLTDADVEDVIWAVQTSLEA
ncbi:MAG TPA: DegT/DnrJ/EryC1/StrS aminotransferase family protein [Candidatus Limnocylindrales bacterium]|jgi:dTDP-4-amino-4,6-dideoxygalactose transaminase|nr:DegT/DnrJ/EryC1/StrS aminotransferase family protein [Candidatus Limnocylindrales bacterium]